MKQKFLSILLTLILLFAAMPFSLIMASGATQYIENGNGNLELNGTYNVRYNSSGADVELVTVDGDLILNGDTTINLMEYHGSYNTPSTFKVTGKIIGNSHKLTFDMGSSGNTAWKTEVLGGIEGVSEFKLIDGELKTTAATPGGIGLSCDKLTVRANGNIKLTAEGTCYGIKTASDLEIAGSKCEVLAKGGDYGLYLGEGSQEKNLTVSAGTLKATATNEAAAAVKANTITVNKGGKIEANANGIVGRAIDVKIVSIDNGTIEAYGSGDSFGYRSPDITLTKGNIIGTGDISANTLKVLAGKIDIGSSAITSPNDIILGGGFVKASILPCYSFKVLPGSIYSDNLGNEYTAGEINLPQEMSELKPLACQVGSTKYYQDEIQAAFGDAVTAQRPVKLIANAKPDTVLTVPSNSVLTLDLNGFALDRGLDADSRTTDGHVIKLADNAGAALNIVDTSEDKTGKITGGATYDSDNDDKSCGGGLYIWRGNSVTMYAGSIEGNYAYKGGGGVYIGENSNFYMISGSVKDNVSAYGMGGGIFMGSKSAICDLQDATITGNSGYKNGESAGGGVLARGTTFRLSGVVKIKDNINSWDGKNDNLYLENYSTYSTPYRAQCLANVLGDLTGSRIGVKFSSDNLPTSGNPVVFTTGGDSHDIANVFVSDDRRYTAEVNSSGEAQLIDQGSWTDFELLQKAIDEAANGATITLTKDYTATDEDGQLVIGKDKNIIIDLAGYNIDRNLGADAEYTDGPVIDVKGGTLELKDSVGGGKVKGGYYGVTVTQDNSSATGYPGNFKLTSGIISDNVGSGVRIDSGTFTMDGGEISNNLFSHNENIIFGGAGVYCNDIFIMNGGKITGNQAKGNAVAGGVLVSGVMTMTGGEITGNTSENKAAGVYLENVLHSELNLSGNPVIADNTVNGKASNLYIASPSKLPTACGNFTDGAKIGISLSDVSRFAEGVFTSGLSGNGTEACFSSDDTSYVVKIKDTGEAGLEKRPGKKKGGSSGSEGTGQQGITPQPGETVPDEGANPGNTESSEGTAIFSDVKIGSWYENPVRFVVKRGIMRGIGGGIFNPNGKTTRAQFVQILFQLDGGKSMDSILHSFSDVKPGQWYANAVIWAANNGITKGEGSTFGVGRDVSRQQLAVLLYNYAKYKGYSVEAAGKLDGYKDGASVASYAQEAMAWAVGSGLIGGPEDGSLAPNASATRAQVAVIIQRFFEKFITE